MMNLTYRKPLIALFAVALVLILIVGGGSMSGSMGSAWMMSHGEIGGYTLMWVPTLLAVGVGILLGWFLFGKRR